jgi:hypothetical protein
LFFEISGIDTSDTSLCGICVCIACVIFSYIYFLFVPPHIDTFPKEGTL